MMKEEEENVRKRKCVEENNENVGLYLSYTHKSSTSKY